LFYGALCFIEELEQLKLFITFYNKK